MSFTGKHFNCLRKSRATDNWNLKADWCRARSIGKVITVVQEILKWSCQLSLKNLFMALQVVYGSPNGLRFWCFSYSDSRPLDVQSSKEKKQRRPLCHLCGQLSFRIAYSLFSNSRLPLPLQPQKASDKWQLHANDMRAFPLADVGKIPNSVWRITQDGGFQRQRNCDQTTPVLTTDLPNLWVIRISHFLYLS